MMTDKQWKMFEDSAHFVKTMGPTYVGIVDHDVLIAAHEELKERRKREGTGKLNRQSVGDGSR